MCKVLLGNKSDLESRKVSQLEIDNFCTEVGVKYFEVDPRAYAGISEDATERQRSSVADGRVAGEDVFAGGATVAGASAGAVVGQDQGEAAQEVVLLVISCPIINRMSKTYYFVKNLSFPEVVNLMCYSTKFPHALTSTQRATRLYRYAASRCRAYLRRQYAVNISENRADPEEFHTNVNKAYRDFKRVINVSEESQDYINTLDHYETWIKDNVDPTMIIHESRPYSASSSRYYVFNDTVRVGPRSTSTSTPSVTTSRAASPAESPAKASSTTPTTPRTTTTG